MRQREVGKEGEEDNDSTEPNSQTAAIKANSKKTKDTD